jgi:hypothetical protein
MSFCAAIIKNVMPSIKWILHGALCLNQWKL